MHLIVKKITKETKEKAIKAPVRVGGRAFDIFATPLLSRPLLSPCPSLLVGSGCRLRAAEESVIEALIEGKILQQSLQIPF